MQHEKVGQFPVLLLLLRPIEATEAVRVLTNFVMTFDKSGAKEREFLHSLSSMEDTFLRIQGKRRRQSTLKEFFH